MPALLLLFLSLLAPPHLARAAQPALCRSVLCKSACRQACNALTLSKVSSTVVAYPKGYSDAALAAELFVPNATLAVSPFGIFFPRIVALEYLTAFSSPSPVPPFVNLTKLSIINTILTDKTASTVFDLFLVNPRDASKAAPLRGMMLLAFDAADSRVTAMTIDYPQFGDTARKILPLELPPAEVDAQVIGPLCEAQAKYCVGANAQWSDQASCRAFLAGVPLGPFPWRLGANSLRCRQFHSRFIPVDPDVHCPHVGPTGGGKCVDDPAPYAYETVDKYIPPGTFVDAHPLLLPRLKSRLAVGTLGGDPFTGGIFSLLGGSGSDGSGGGGGVAADAGVDLWGLPTKSPPAADALLIALIERERASSAAACAQPESRRAVPPVLAAPASLVDQALRAKGALLSAAVAAAVPVSPAVLLDG